MNRSRFTADCRQTKGRTRSFTEENCAVDQKADKGQGRPGAA